MFYSILVLLCGVFLCCVFMLLFGSGLFVLVLCFVLLFVCLLVVVHCCFNGHIQLKNNESQCKLQGFDDRGQILTVGLLSSGANVGLAFGDLGLLGLLSCCAVGALGAVGLLGITYIAYITHITCIAYITYFAYIIYKYIHMLKTYLKTHMNNMQQTHI